MTCQAERKKGYEEAKAAALSACVEACREVRRHHGRAAESIAALVLKSAMVRIAAHTPKRRKS